MSMRNRTELMFQEAIFTRVSQRDRHGGVGRLRQRRARRVGDAASRAVAGALRGRACAPPHAERPPLRGHGARADLAFVTQAGRGVTSGQQGEIPERPRVREAVSSAANLSRAMNGDRSVSRSVSPRRDAAADRSSGTLLSATGAPKRWFASRIVGAVALASSATQPCSISPAGR